MGNVLAAGILAVIVVIAAYSTYKKMTRGGGCCPEREADEKRVKVQDKNRSHYSHSVTLRVDGMTCSNCARRVENALNSMDGVWADQVSFAEGRVHVLSKEHPDIAAVKQQLAEKGYIVLGVSEE